MTLPTLEEIRGRWYGPGYSYFGGGFENFKPHNQNQCSEQIEEYTNYGPRSGVFKQCTHKPGHGPHGAFCKQHAKQYGGAGDE